MKRTLTKEEGAARRQRDVSEFEGFVSRNLQKAPAIRGAGDWLEKKLHPIAKAIHWPCLDEDKETLKPDSPCAKARDGLNRLVPFGASEGKPGA